MQARKSVVRAFLSHSSSDKSVAIAVHDALRPRSIWLDRAEIEWGQPFIEAIEAGIQSASDFVLLWSAAAAQSEWVRHETHMAFIRMLQEQAIRIRVIKLDTTELPLRLKPFQFLSVAESDSPVDDIVSQLQKALSQPSSGARHRFLNRNKELDRIESLINDTGTRIILIQGFKGVGKSSIVGEALRRFYEGASTIELTVGPGTGPAEIALQLHYEAFGAVLPENGNLEALAAIEKSVTKIIGRGQFLVIKDCQHWLGDEQDLNEPLPTLVRHASSLPKASRKPVFLTSTRRWRMSPEFAVHLSNVHLHGLSNSNMASLLALWHEIIEGKRLDLGEAKRVASELHGHPIAAKLAAELVAQHGSQHLLEYPRELFALRRDLAKTLIHDLELSPDGLRLMETLAIVGTPLPSAVLAKAIQMDDATFHNAVNEAARAGFSTSSASTKLKLHPLLSDYFWRSHLDRQDYTQRAKQVSTVLHDHLRSLSTDSAEFVTMLPAVYRLYVLAGDLAEAQTIRRGLTGELILAAITHYNRRKYDLAEKFITLVLEAEPRHWKMRVYLARIHVRRGRWNEADKLIGQLLREKPQSPGIGHLHGWRLLRANSFEDALSAFLKVLNIHNQHVASYRDAAECLYRIGRSKDALDFLGKAKQIESDNPFVLDLEARIYEERGQFEEALAAARVAVVRNTSNWGLRHRLSRILAALGQVEEALIKAKEAIQLDPAQFVPYSHLISLLIDVGHVEKAASHMNRLEELITDRKQKDIYEHLNARIAFQKHELDQAIELVQRQIRKGHNLAANYGLLCNIRIAQAKQAPHGSATSELYLEQAKAAANDCEKEIDHDPRMVRSLREKLALLNMR